MNASWSFGNLVFDEKSDCDKAIPTIEKSVFKLIVF